MITVSSLDAQNQFGLLLDSSQREPVTITRRGRPVAVLVSYQDYHGYCWRECNTRKIFFIPSST